MPIGPRANTTFWQDWVNLALGLWLFVSPWVLGYTGLAGAATNSWILGIAVAAVATAALISYAQWEEWLNAVFGLWLLVSPWVIGFVGTGEASVAPLWNHVLVGVAVAVLALWDGLAHASAERAPI
ncbi:SPW repeat protein [Magnetospirillum sp. UT-4]|uniref:SPW repeat protein n=1 Tax=Magnetospirillum sp. UT-4 TaxID=2681467 RepID=UPI00137D27F1|nr:SPW repeat protein [Magnetospirillum sp. UT-4]CAA7620699.1 SPW repeat protein (modular protein) [Magnetospirillum sp. UT-4]